MQNLFPPRPHHLIAVTSLGDGSSRVTYSSNIRMRVCHMTERDAGFVTLDCTMRGLGDGLGIYDVTIMSDVVSTFIVARPLDHAEPTLNLPPVVNSRSIPL
jgi:hypothetical protein